MLGRTEVMEQAYQQGKHAEEGPEVAKDFRALKKIFFYCCSIKVVPILLSLHSPALPTPTSHIQSSIPSVVFVHGSFIHDP